MRMRVTAQGFTAVCKMAMTLRCALLSLFLAAVFPFATPSSHCDDATVDVDMTLQSGATGEDVVLATVNKIEDSGIFPDNFGFLRRMAAVETSDGNTFIADTGGILRIDATTFTFVNIFVPGSDFEDTFQEEFYFEWSNTITGYGDLDVPLYSALAVMVRLNITGHSILSDDINEQAQIWKNLFHLDEDVQVFIEIVQQLEAIAECNISRVDMIFVMDESGSIRAENFELMKQFAINVTDRFEIGPNHAQVGWINFNGMARVVFNLNTYEDKASLHDAIRAVTYSGGGTDIGAGLLALHDYGFLESAGARNTFDIPEVAIVVTDGQSDLGPIESAAQLLRDNRNVNVFVVGVGSGVRIEQLNAVASAGIATDNINHVYQLSGFQEFDVIEETIRARTCFDAMFADHETSIERLNMTERTIQMTTIHINLECPPDGLTINACGREGKTFLYISTNPSPNSARYHKIIEVSAGECKNAFIDCSGCDNGSGRRRRQAVGTDSGEKIYITIEGVEEENIYELGAEKGDHSTPQVNLHCVKKVTDDRAGVVVSCTSDRELTDIKCSIINCSPAAPCTLPWTVNFTPPIRDYHLQINVTDSLNLTDSVTVVHQVGPLGLVCSLNTELKVECSSSNQLAPNDTVCTFNGVTEDPCILPHEIDVKGLPVGTHTIHVIATDVFEQTAETTVDYIVVEDRVGDDMVFSTVLDIRPIEVGVSEPTVSLCYQVHGQEGHFYNLISDYCVSVNAHISQPKTEVDSHVIDKIGIRAIGSNGTCYSIAIIRENCAISINGTLLPINSKFEEESVVVRNVRRITRKPNVVHISVPNCGRPLVDTMHITCTEYHIRHSAIPTEVLEFTTTRGLSPIDAAHGLLGQFWGRFMLGQPLSPVQGQNDKEMTIFHQPRLKRFNGFVHRSWSSRGEMCFYAGDRQGGPVILGQYEDYEVETLLSTEYIFSKFEGETFDP